MKELPEWPCLDTMKIVKILIITMLFLAFSLIAFLLYINYRVNLNTSIQTQKIADFITTQLDVQDDQNQGDKQSDLPKEETCCTLH